MKQPERATETQPELPDVKQLEQATETQLEQPTQSNSAPVILLTKKPKPPRKKKPAVKKKIVRTPVQSIAVQPEPSVIPQPEKPSPRTRESLPRTGDR